MRTGAERRVLVWCLALDALPATAWAAMEALLRNNEVAALTRLGRPEDRRTVIAGRALAKALLGAATGTAPGDWQLFTDARGAPHARAPAGREAPRLSLSRTRGAVAAAVSLEGAVGVDIERHDAGLDGSAIATALFAPVDRETIDAARDVNDAFFGVWTLKEAVLKALGTGFALPPAHVGILSLDPPRAGFAPDGYAEAPGWTLGTWTRGPFRIAAACPSKAEMELRWMRVAQGDTQLFEPGS